MCKKSTENQDQVFWNYEQSLPVISLPKENWKYLSDFSEDDNCLNFEVR